LFGETCHYLLQLGFMSCLNVEPDELHIMHLGTTMYLLGSCLWVLCFVILQGSPSENMARVWADICTAYRRFGSGCQFTTLALSSFCDPSAPRSEYPKLKGRGAEVICLENNKNKSSTIAT
jgi:hypothetical protein